MPVQGRTPRLVAEDRGDAFVLGGPEDDRLLDPVLLQRPRRQLAALAEEAVAVVLEAFAVLVVTGGADALGAGRVVRALGFALAPVEAEQAQFPVLQLLEGAA